VNVAIHIRRGDVEETNYYSNRYTGNAYYVKIIEKLNKTHDNCNICIFSQGSEGFDEFNQFENVKLMNDLDVLETFEYMCNSDILIMAKSSLSYLAGLYSKKEVYMQPFEHYTHSKLSRWKYTDELIDDDESLVESYTNITSNNMKNMNNIYRWITLFVFVFFIFFVLVNKQFNRILRTKFKIKNKTYIYIFVALIFCIVFVELIPLT
jgi:hypothetical protein